jgi:hypothetical protein
MLKKALLALALVVTAPLLVNCAASGAGSVGEDGASGSATGTAGSGDTRSTSKTTTEKE